MAKRLVALFVRHPCRRLAKVAACRSCVPCWARRPAIYPIRFHQSLPQRHSPRQVGSAHVCAASMSPSRVHRDKENVVSGQKPGFQSIATPSPGSLSTSDALEDACHAAVRGEGPHAEDPLAPAVSYVEWASKTFAPRAPGLLRALQVACENFIGDGRYVDDHRYVRLWVQYADIREDTLDVVAFMRSNSIGRTDTLFYEIWASTLELNKRDFQGTEAVYKLGLERGAHPRPRLQRRYDAFKERMVKRARRDKARASKRRERPATEDAPASQVPKYNNSSAVSGERARVEASSSVHQSATSPKLSLPVGNGSMEHGRDDVPQKPSPSRQGALRDIPAALASDGGSKAKHPLQERPALQQRPEFEVYADEESANHPVSGDTSRDKGQTSNLIDGDVSRASMGAASGVTSPTINTKLAMKEVDDMFNVTLPLQDSAEDVRGTIKDEGDSVATVQQLIQRPVSTFEVYCDDADHTADIEVVAKGRGATPVSSGHGAVNGFDNISEHQETFRSNPDDVPGDVLDFSELCVESCTDLSGYHLLDNTELEVEAFGNLVLKSAGGERRSFYVEAKLGDGREGTSSVFEAVPLDAMSAGTEVFDENTDPKPVAIKCADTTQLLWEFYMYDSIYSRHKGRTSISGIPRALFCYHGSKKSFLILDYVGVATLDQLLDARSHSRGYITSRLVLFIVIELLRVVELVHEAGVIHSDVTLENVALRRESENACKDPRSVGDLDSWSHVGIALLDFNHAVDVRHPATRRILDSDTSGESDGTAEDIAKLTWKLGSKHMDERYISLAENEAWGFNIDCHGVASCAKRLLGESDGDGVNIMVWANVMGRLNGTRSDTRSEETAIVMKECRASLTEELISQGSEDESLWSEFTQLYQSAVATRDFYRSQISGYFEY